jgi:WD40 repeat protein
MNPFPGLRPFTPEEDHLFFGREEQTLELLRRLGGHRFVAVVGTSGSGKSSLVRCGLLSELLGGKMLGAGAAWEVAVTHPGGNPIGLLTEALLDAGLYDRQQESARENLLATLSRSHFGLVEAVKQAALAPNTNFLLVVDQFEEIFRFHEAGQTQQEMASEFVSLLLEAAQQKQTPIYIVLTMRSDFIGECGQFDRLAEAVNRGEFLIPRLTREQYKRVIEGPIKVAGGQIAPRLLQRLLNDLGQQADQLPCLQHALMRTWTVWAEKSSDNGDGALDLDDYHRVGKMSQALSLHADEIYESLASDRQRQLCRGLFQAITVQQSDNRGIRRPQRLGRLCQILDVPAAEITPIIDAYRRHGVTFLMPSPEVELTDRTIIDISHESLMRVWTRLRRWVEDEAQAAGIYLRLSESAALHRQGKAGLYRDPELGIAQAWQESQHPNAAWAERYRGGFDAAMTFLRSSQEAAAAEEQAREAARQQELDHARELAEARQQRLEQQQRGARKLRKMIAVLAVVALIAAMALIAALVANQQARRNEESATLSAKQARQAQKDANQARVASETAKEDAQAEAYRAVLSEARALRAGREPGWRDEALADLSRLAASNSPKRDLFELRTEAAAAIGTPDVRLVARIDPSAFPSSFAFDPGSPRLAVVCGQSALDFWNLQDLKPTGSTEPLGGKQPASVWLRSKAIFLPGGRGLAVATVDKGIVFADPFGKRSPRAPITRGNSVPHYLSVDSTATRLAVGWGTASSAMSGVVTVHDLATGQKLDEATGPACAISPDGQWLAHEGAQGEVRLRHIASKDPEKTLGKHEGAITNFAFSGDGATVASASRDRTAALWDVSGQRQPIVLRGHRETLNDVAFSPDGGWVVTASTDFTARIWDAVTGQSLATLPNSWFMLDAGWSADGAFLAVGGDHNSAGSSMSLYRVTGRQIYQRLAAHFNGVQCITAHPRLDQISTGADDHTAMSWDLATTRPAKRWSSTESEFVTALAYSPDGSLIATATGFGAVLVRDTETGQVKFNLPGHKFGVHGLAFDPSGKRLASGDRSGHITLWDLATQKPVQELRVGASFVWSIAFLDEGRKLVSEVSNGSVILFDLESGKPLTGVMPPGGIRRFIPDPTRNRLILAFNNGDLSSLSLPDLKSGPRLEHAHSTSIESLALSPDGRILATGGADRRVVFRDPVTFEPLVAFPQWTAMIKDLAFTPSGRWLAYVGADSDVALWDLTALRDGLQAAGLAWDKPASEGAAITSRSLSGSPTTAPTLRALPTTLDSAVYAQARGLITSGVAAYSAGHPAEAIPDLEKARDLLRPLHKASPTNHPVASQLAISLGFLSNALHDQQRLDAAFACRTEARQILEAMGQPSALDLYNLACTYATLMDMPAPGSPPLTPAERDALAAKALAALARSFAAGLKPGAGLDIDGDHDLDSLRDRPDFAALMLQSTGRTREALPYLAKLSAATPNDALSALRLAALQAWLADDQGLAATCDRWLAIARDTKDPVRADRTAKICSLRQLDDKTHAAALILARRAVELGAKHPYLPYFQMDLGMAEYRSGHFPEADAALLEASRIGNANVYVSGTAPFYRAMSLHRQGKTDEARQVAAAAAAKMKPLPPDPDNPQANGANGDDLILWLAYKEARALIHFDTRAATKPAATTKAADAKD